MEWTYQNKEYYTEPIEVHKGEYGEIFEDFNTIKQWVDNYGLVWHRKWNKVYKLVNARDADETLCLYTTKPWKRIATEYHNNDFDCDDEFMNIDNKLFPEVTFENSPQRVELKLIKEE